MALALDMAARRNRKVAGIAAFGALAMLGLGFASVPLYRMFCQATGFGGTTMRATAAQAAAVKTTARPITIRFDGNVTSGLPWQFRPEQVTQDGHIGERKMAFFIAKNTSNRPIVGRAIFNVTPEQTGAYFHKIQCFCFNEQKLEPGEEVRMPVIYYVDPEMLNDPNARDVPEITLSYTFMEAADSGSGSASAPLKNK
ncbi:cytochrome c oxidase assembly protein [Novosphingobium sp. PASSN1]|uniref:cytochrome c oxidase assembly protein n=1 Tax=Novosphingobium sp. PASSN1 TaxID=2015561 RepID=UPI000BC8158A|nr:cytochrome c oxidase assembly protein [Novosphingobium sp. PASSN1]OYU35055.1 MAG: cytochrome c oxidase assembly protein [Novosphingobium sp. PASSN1]